MLKIPPETSDIRLVLHYAGKALLRAKRALDSVFFPFRCSGCGESVPYPEALCENCSRALPRINAPYCRACGTPFPGFWKVTICPGCRQAKLPLTRLRSCFLYEGMVRQMIRDAKYRRCARYLRFFAAEMYLLARSEFPSHIGAIVPVPLHKQRQWDRTYNQSELMARDLARWWQIPMWTGLKRIRRTPAQSGLSGRARRRNLKEAFAVTTLERPKSVLLVDDVVTTGATLETCARVLRRSGIRRVYAITIARAVRLNR